MGMSSLKYRLQKLLPSLSEQSKSCQDREIKQRLYVIKAIATSKRTIKAACEFRGIGRDQFYEWANRLLDKGDITGLVSKSKRPKRSPKRTSPRIEKKISLLKNKKPFLGPERLSRELEKNHKMVCPPSTVYAVLRRNKLISKEYRKQRTKKHTKRYRRPVPGFMQMDFKYVPILIDKRQYYQLSAVDHCSSWRLIRCYEHKGEEQVLEFLQELRRECPFAIVEIQTDNDAAFTDKYTSGMGVAPSGVHVMDQWCEKHSIRHKLIPIGEKELNGKVENTHKYDDEEFYSHFKFKDLSELITKTYLHNIEWNEHRKTKTLGWKTPEEVVCGYLFTFRLIKLWFDCLEKEIKEQGLDTWVGLPIQLPAPQKRVKKSDPIDRYLDWMKWEAAQYPKYSILAVSAMSQIYSSGSFPNLFIGFFPNNAGGKKRRKEHRTVS